MAVLTAQRSGNTILVREAPTFREAKETSPTTLWRWDFLSPSQWRPASVPASVTADPCVFTYLLEYSVFNSGQKARRFVKNRPRPGQCGSELGRSKEPPGNHTDTQSAEPWARLGGLACVRARRLREPRQEPGSVPGPSSEPEALPPRSVGRLPRGGPGVAKFRLRSFEF